MNEKSELFDLLILGSGPAASRVAPKCAQQGWQVGVVDPRPIGGTCALRGCNPKKVLVRAAELKSVLMTFPTFAADLRSML